MIINSLPLGEHGKVSNYPIYFFLKSIAYIAGKLFFSLIIAFGHAIFSVGEVLLIMLYDCSSIS